MSRLSIQVLKPLHPTVLCSTENAYGHYIFTNCFSSYEERRWNKKFLKLKKYTMWFTNFCFISFFHCLILLHTYRQHSDINKKKFKNIQNESVRLILSSTKLFETNASRVFGTFTISSTFHRAGRTICT